MYLDANNKRQEVQATWQVVAKDYCVCNCKVVRVVNWTRGGRVDPATGKLGAPQYTNISVQGPPANDTNSNWSNTQLQWINQQLVKDDYDVILDK